MTQVRIFKNSDIECIQQAVNKFLALPGVKYVDIKWAAMTDDYAYRTFSAVLVYEQS